MPEDPLQFPQLIPPLGDDLLADDALSAVTTQIPDTPDLTTDMQTDPDEPYGLSWQWDFAVNRFVRVGGAPVRVSELDNLRIWVQGALNTARNAHPIYDDDYGIDGGWGSATGVMIGELQDDPAVQEQYMQAVYDALTVHDRVTDVTNFDFWDNPDDRDSAYVDFEIHTDDGDILPISLVITE